MQISFWGVRGSIPAPERQNWRYGGNTPCVEVRANGEVIILDAGTGIRELGNQLSAELASPGLTAHLLLTHYHWDHVLGLPFFEPIYFAGNTFHIYGPHPEGARTKTLQEALETIFMPPFFPVTAEQLQSTRILHELDWESEFAIGAARIRACRTNHPQGTLAYRLEADSGVFAYATDHEPGDPERDTAIRRLAAGADLLVSDAQYRPEEIGAKYGWGHGTWAESVTLARDAGAKNLVLFHHEPVRSDDELDRILVQARNLFPNTWVAAEGMMAEISAGSVRITSRANRLSQRAPIRLPAFVETRFGGKTHREEAQLENLSLFGAYFFSNTPYQPQQPIELTIPQTDAAALPNAPAVNGELRLVGYVLRTDRLSTNLMGVAVCFPGRAEPGAAEPAAGGRPRVKDTRPTK